MKLEHLVQNFGMVDYYDMYTGNTYMLSKAIDNNDGTLSVPVMCDGQFIGFAKMNKKEIE